ncbi:DUF2059 domain-containing protein [Sphingomonas sp. QA11]|uniref:DUF2059 domain-containing protein n=1 Tax=Sphingomonas sp. QA11 TaxID=2950605 RepID=UPI00234B2566|nr:DUF2059 domain-containing protein [Sphingomonas sp. QA11]WCM26266.1 DUF2059 domain-containing protein [Sphingomonas sp. QA11]
MIDFMRYRHCLAAGLMLAAVPAAGQKTVPAASAATSAPIPSIDPERHAIAQAVVDKVFPPGTYRRMMDGTLSQMMSSMTDRMMDIPVADLARMGGIPEDKLHNLKPATLRQAMKIIDPVFDQRMKKMMDVMMPAMIDLMDTMEPDVRVGVVEAYERHFATSQLVEMNRFFSTPVGTEYAAQSMLMFTDPAVIARMKDMMPKMMAAMPVIMAKVKAVTDDMPKPGKMTAKQKADLAALFEGDNDAPRRQEEIE